MPHVNVRRLAAVDVYGAPGTRLRRMVIVAEFAAGALGMVLIGVLVTADSSTTSARLLGGWFIGVGLNYVPLLAHTLSLLPRGRLHAELAAVDVPAELQHYTFAQLWVLVPLLFVVLALGQAREASA